MTDLIGAVLIVAFVAVILGAVMCRDFYAAGWNAGYDEGRDDERSGNPGLRRYQ